MATPEVFPQQEVTIYGRHTRSWSIDDRACPELRTHRIARLGLDTAHAPYRRVRPRPAGSFFLASLGGEGQMLLEGRWQRVKAGALCLAPPRVLNAFHAIAGQRWEFAWIRYDEPSWIKPLVGADSPLKLDQSARDLGRAIEGLRTEWESERDPTLVHHWLSLVHGMARRSAQPWRGDSRISALWYDVNAALAATWDLPTLARRCSLSTEQLRRLCVRELGRTPMEHVTYMRMRRAQELLETTDDKLEVLAPLVGYRSAIVFSRAFLRCVGLTPSQYRAKRPPSH